MLSCLLLWSNSVNFAGFLKKLISAAVILYLSCSFSVQVSLPYSEVGIAKVHCTRDLVAMQHKILNGSLKSNKIELI
jgi:hypothetical protein